MKTHDRVSNYTLKPVNFANQNGSGMRFIGKRVFEICRKFTSGKNTAISLMRFSESL